MHNDNNNNNNINKNNNNNKCWWCWVAVNVNNDDGDAAADYDDVNCSNKNSIYKYSYKNLNMIFLHRRASYRTSWRATQSAPRTSTSCAGTACLWAPSMPTWRSTNTRAEKASSTTHYRWGEHTGLI